MWFARFFPVLLILLAHVSSAQDFDKKTFCVSLRNAMSAFEASRDSLKGEYIGASSAGDKQWKAKFALSGAQSGTYDHYTYLANEFRATYVIKEKMKSEEAGALFKQLVNATKSCYGTDFLLKNSVTSEGHYGVKIEQMEAKFTRAEYGGTGHLFPYIRISSTAYDTGDAFEVLVELISQE